MNKRWVLILLTLQFSCFVFANVKLNESTTVVFASVEQGQKILEQKDIFVQSMSPFDRAARMKTDAFVSQEDYIAFLHKNVLSWTEDEHAKLKIILQDLSEKLAPFHLDLPETVYLVKTTGQEEGQAAYTRSSAIILPQSEVNTQPDHLKPLIAHELFHVLSRNNPQLRPNLYNIIGFKPCNEIEFPADLKPRKLTNPDAPQNNFYIEVLQSGKKVCVVPILFSRTLKYDVQKGGEFFNYLVFKFLVVRKNEGNQLWEPVYADNVPVLLEVEDLGNFFEQVGKNSNYIIHPEETLADNFSLLVMGQNVPSPWVLDKLQNFFVQPNAENEG